ncbi:MAG: hypothetical protein R3C14_44050 [Caldilineaceae bacterium]
MRTQYVSLAAEHQQARPVGIRVVEPPLDTQQALRGNLYVLVEYAGNAPEQSKLIESALNVVQRTYYTVKGSQSFVLGEALREALKLFPYQEVADPPRNGQPGVLLVALLDNRLTAIGLGAALALISNDDKVDVYPPPGATLQADGTPAVEIYRQEIQEGATLLLAGQRCLQHFRVRDLASTVAFVTSQNLPAVAADLRDYAQVDDLTGLILLATPGAPSAPPPNAPAKPRRSFWGGLPAALQTRPPVHDLPPLSSGRDAADAGLDEELHPESARRAYSGRPQSSGEHAAAPSATAGEDAQASAAQADAGNLQQSFSALTEVVKLGWLRTSAFVRGLLPEHSSVGSQAPLEEATQAEYRQPVPMAAPTPREHLHTERTATIDLPAYEAAAVTTAPRTAAPTAAERIASFTPPARATGKRARLYILLAVLILILTPVVVATVYWARNAQNEDEANRALELAEASFVEGQNYLENSDKSGARTKFLEAQSYLTAATDLVGGRLPRADELAANIASELADLEQIYPLYALATPLVRFPPEAAPQRVLVGDQDVYVLDSERRMVQRFQLDQTNNIVTNPEGETVMQAGDVIEGVTVGNPIDITWQPPIAGIQDKPYLLVLDHNNNIFRYDRRVEGASRLILGEQDTLRTLSKLKVYADRLYIADAGSGQIYRYSGNYSTPPDPWFDPQTQADLTGLRTMNIDGDIWLLYERGDLRRYRSGSQVPFSLENSAAVIAGAIDIAVGDQGNSLVYVADSAEERIVVFNKEGQYQYQFRAPEGHPLRDLRGLFVDEVGGTMYLLTQSSLFKHPLTIR